MPYKAVKWAQESSHCHFFRQNTQKKGRQIPRTDVGIADSEALPGPCPEQSRKEEQIAQCRVLRPQGTQESIVQPQDASHRHAQQETPDSKRRMGHRRSLPSQPRVSRFSS